MTLHTRNLKEIAILNKDLVLGDPPLMVKKHTFDFLIFGPFPNWELSYLDLLRNLGLVDLAARQCKRSLPAINISGKKVTC